MSKTSSDAGNAVVEFVFLSLLILVPLILGAASLAVMVRSENAAAAVVREASRAYALTEDDGVGRAHAVTATALVAQAYNLRSQPDLDIRCIGNCISTITRVRVSTSFDIRLPLLNVVHTARATHVVTVRQP